MSLRIDHSRNGIDNKKNTPDKEQPNKEFDELYTLIDSITKHPCMKDDLPKPSPFPDIPEIYLKTNAGKALSELIESWKSKYDMQVKISELENEIKGLKKKIETFNGDDVSPKLRELADKIDSDWDEALKALNKISMQVDYNSMEKLQRLTCDIANFYKSSVEKIKELSNVILFKQMKVV